jgi:hypothetical protein
VCVLRLGWVDALHRLPQGVRATLHGSSAADASPPVDSTRAPHIRSPSHPCAAPVTTTPWVATRLCQVLLLLLRLRQACDHPFLVIGRPDKLRDQEDRDNNNHNSSSSNNSSNSSRINNTKAAAGRASSRALPHKRKSQALGTWGDGRSSGSDDCGDADDADGTDHIGSSSGGVASSGSGRGSGSAELLMQGDGQDGADGGAGDDAAAAAAEKEMAEEERLVQQAVHAGPSRNDFVNDLMNRFMQRAGGTAAVLSDSYVKRVISNLADRSARTQHHHHHGGLVSQMGQVVGADANADGKDLGDKNDHHDDEEEDHEECPICLDSFDNPVLTPCAHVTCYDCMPGARAAAAAVVNGGGKQLTCPVCRLGFTHDQLTFVTNQADEAAAAAGGGAGGAAAASNAAFGSLKAPPPVTKWSKPKPMRDAKSISDAIAAALRRQRREQEDALLLAQQQARHGGTVGGGGGGGGEGQGAGAGGDVGGAVLRVPTVAEMKLNRAKFTTSSKLQVCVRVPATPAAAAPRGRVVLFTN